MIIPKNLVDKVRHYLGLNMYETQIWLALLSHGIATAGELAEASGVPRSRAYDILNSLSKKGLVVVKESGRPIKYMAVPLEQALKNLEKYYEAEAVKAKQEFENLRNSEFFKKLREQYSQAKQFVDSTDLVGLIREKLGIYSHLVGRLASAKKELRIFAMPEDVKELEKHYLDVIKNAKAKGVSIKLIVPEGTEVGELGKYCEVKTTAVPIPRAIVLDGKEAMVMVADPSEIHPSFDSGVWAASEILAATLNKMFDEIWHGQ